MAVKKTINNRQFVFEYLFDKSKNITAYLVTTKEGKGAISIEMEIDNNATGNLLLRIHLKKSRD